MIPLPPWLPVWLAWWLLSFGIVAIFSSFTGLLGYYIGRATAPMRDVPCARKHRDER